MAEVVSIYCPHCGRHTALSIARSQESEVPVAWNKAEGRVVWIGICNACGDAVLVESDAYLGVVAIHPSPRPPATDPAVPDEIRADFDEAKLCLAVGAVRACAVMARRALQSACADKGATKSKLADQIDELAANGSITAGLQKWAHVVRWVGNDAAHPRGDLVTSDDADDILKLADQFFHVLYVTPALADAQRTKRGKP